MNRESCKMFSALKKFSAPPGGAHAHAAQMLRDSGRVRQGARPAGGAGVFSRLIL
jgi:hypothetical protein